MDGGKAAGLILVIGPIGAGKTTWARDQQRALGPSWWLIDRETLQDALQQPRKYTPQARSFAGRLFDAALDHAAARRLSCVVTITGATPADRARVLGRFDPAVWWLRIVCVAPVDPQVAIRRAQADPLRPKTARSTWPGMVLRWYRDYVPPPGVIAAGD